MCMREGNRVGLSNEFKLSIFLKRNKFSSTVLNFRKFYANFETRKSHQMPKYLHKRHQKLLNKSQ
ncbi:hypothetical protein DOY81_006163 [Sarcophaga bullata]|nr:hypothetical protein DOY81_006163 [Sarcophaga bullata]